MNRKTDIVVTVGPSSEDYRTMERLIIAGANVFRFPFAREPFEVNVERTLRLQEVANRLGIKVYTLQDVPGRKLRLATREDTPVEAGERVTIGIGSYPFPKKHFELDAKPVFLDAVAEGTIVYFGDGEIEAWVCNRLDTGLLACEIVNNGVVQGLRGITFQSYFGSERGLTERDKDLLQRAAYLNYDYIALSFVQTQEEIQEATEIYTSIGGNSPKVIAKIETQGGVDNLESILKVCYGVMVARGDLAIQVSYERLPALQRHILTLAAAQGAYSIVATQMIESIETRRVPNRSEIIDVANAVYQGASAVMCSGETRTGKQPVYAVEAIDRIVRQAERDKLPT